MRIIDILWLSSDKIETIPDNPIAKEQIKITTDNTFITPFQFILRDRNKVQSFL